MILVTGATGNNGREVIKQLTAAGAAVRAFVRDGEKTTELERQGAQIALGDFDHPDTISAALAGVERALLLPPNTPRQTEQEVNFIEAAKRARVGHVVKFSVLGADEASPSRIGRWHAAAERRLEASGIAFTHLRPNFFMQNLLLFAAPVKAGGALRLPLKNAAVSMVDVRDIAAVATAALTGRGHEGKTYDITGAEALTLADAAARLSAATGERVAYQAVSPDEFKQDLLKNKQEEWYADALNEVYEAVADGQNALVTNAVTEVARKQPINFDSFARDYASAFRSGKDDE